MSECTEEQFLKDIKTHEISIIRDEGVHRHIRFRSPGTIIYGFDLITWPGHLCITGDCGTYVFQRTEDMFGFFRPSKGQKNNPESPLYINTGYWGEKLLSIGTNAGYKEFDEDQFEERVKEHFNNWVECEELTSAHAEELWRSLQSDVLSAVYDGEHSAYRAIQDFKYEGFTFEDFFDAGGTERFTFHYLWCLYGIAWGIQQYDLAKTKEEK